MLAKKHRLNLSVAENSQLFTKSERFSTENLLFYYRTNQSHLKVAALAPTRLFNKAAERNHSRRLIYQLINQINRDHKIITKTNLLELKLDLIIVYKNNKAKSEEIAKELKLFFDQILKKYEAL
ncbi:MAG TPA: ribonuclease P protein component [Candidatus Woesebacteria bacterium]|jgi:ribonuclease P protein component|nr:ribonuclease P protein component [Candidatus Woesebacteria bacterium]